MLRMFISCHILKHTIYIKCVYIKDIGAERYQEVIYWSTFCHRFLIECNAKPRDRNTIFLQRINRSFKLCNTFPYITTHIILTPSKKLSVVLRLKRFISIILQVHIKLREVPAVELLHMDDLYNQTANTLNASKYHLTVYLL